MLLHGSAQLRPDAIKQTLLVHVRLVPDAGLGQALLGYSTRRVEQQYVPQVAQRLRCANLCRVAQRAADLPLGIRQRLSLAVAIIHEPEILILDEPTSGVDPLARARLWETVAIAATTGTGVLVTTHYMDEAGECDRLMVMADGRVVAEGTAGQITGDARVSVVETGSWAAAFAALEAAGLPATLVGRTLRVPGADPVDVRRALGPVEASVTVAPATLEERFFELTLTSSRAREA